MAVSVPDGLVQNIFSFIGLLQERGIQLNEADGGKKR